MYKMPGLGNESQKSAYKKKDVKNLELCHINPVSTALFHWAYSNALMSWEYKPINLFIFTHIQMLKM